MKKLLFILIVTIAGCSEPAALRLPKLLSEGMVLQRNANLTIWGWDNPGQEISIQFMDNEFVTKTDKEGRWEVKLPEYEAGGPYEMKIIGSAEIMVSDILIGDVWLCSGQSNMELTMQRASPLYMEEIKNSANNMIRQFEVPDRYDFKAPREDLEYGAWIAADPEPVLKFSAVGYFFACYLNKKYEVPIGLINASLGGSPAQAWMSEEVLQEFPHYLEEMKKFKNDSLIARIQREEGERSNNWYNRSTESDLGEKSDPTWHSPELDVSSWEEMSIPGYWAEESLGEKNGVVWFRKKFDLPSSMEGKEVDLDMGRIVDADSTFVNGVFVGNVTYQYPPRRYRVPAGVLREGENSIVVRVINTGGRGGFVEDKPYLFRLNEDTVDLRGTWKYKLGSEMDPLPGQTFIRWKPGGLYNAMLAPLRNYRIKGAIWYQGESNADSAPYEYRTLFPAMINDWRKNWQIGDFPVIYVQLANFMEARVEPGPSNWAMLRESQLLSLNVPNTAMAVIIDIGEWNDIHPLNKKDVGYRLALGAQKVAYNEDIVYSGPIYKNMEIRGDQVVISFDQTGSGLTAKGELSGFAIAGENKEFFRADARIEGDQVIVRSDKVSSPAAVRYAWADNPDNANLYNTEGLPASPFRTDSWDE